METNVYPYKNALPNKLMDEDGNITDLKGHVVLSSVVEWDNKPALPNKFLNPDGTYSTLDEILVGGDVSADIFIITQTLPIKGEDNKIYLVPNNAGTFDEYHFHNGKWDVIGSLDASNLVTTEQLQNTIKQLKLYTDTEIQKNITSVLGGEY